MTHSVHADHRGEPVCSWWVYGSAPTESQPFHGHLDAEELMVALDNYADGPPGDHNGDFQVLHTYGRWICIRGYSDTYCFGGDCYDGGGTHTHYKESTKGRGAFPVTVAAWVEPPGQ